MTPIGLVSLVGAGPGHPDYLTQKAARRLREADLVLYDALVDPEVLAIAERAEWVSVGKRAGRLQTSQAAIEQPDRERRVGDQRAHRRHQHVQAGVADQLQLRYMAGARE